MATLIGDSWTKLVEYASTYSNYTITYRLYAMYTATTVASNQHTIKMRWTTTKTSGGTGIYDNDACTPTVTYVSSGSTTATWTGTSFTITKGSTTSETTQTTSGDITITHDSNGSYSKTWNWSLSHVYSGGSKSGSVTVTLPTIPRASTFTLSSTSIYTNSTTTLNIARADSSFTHKLTTTYGGSTHYLLGSSSSASSNYQNVSISVPSSLKTAIASANASSANLTLTLTTYSGSTVIGTSTGSLSLTVPTATVSMSATSVSCSSNITWTLANVDTGTCTYTVARKYGSNLYNGANDTTKATTTSKSVANSWFQTKMGSVTSGTITTTVTTYSGTTVVGSSTATYTVTIPTNTYYWKASNPSSGAITYKGELVSGKSLAGYEGLTVKFSIAAQNSSSSTYKSHTITASRSNITFTSSRSGGTITVTVGTLPSSNSDYTFTLTCTVTDSRNTSSSVTSATITATGYSVPTLTGSVQRALSNGTVDSEGTAAKFNLTGTAYSSTSLSNLTISSIVVKEGSTERAKIDNQSSASVTLTSTNTQKTYATNTQYTFVATVTDSLGNTNTLTLVMGTAGVVLSLHPSGGVGMGKVAVANRVDVAYPIFTVWNSTTTSEIRSGDTTSAYSSYVGAHGLSGKIYLVASGTATGNKALTAVNNANTTNDILRVNQDNELLLVRPTYISSSIIATTGAQTVGYFFKPTNTHADSAVQTPGRIYYQTSVAGSEGRFAFREYSPTSADVTKYVNFYEYYFLPAPDKDRTATSNYEILTTKNLVTEAQGGTGQSSLANVTVGNATSASNSTLAYRLEGALAGKSGTTTTNRWYKIGTCTITGANTDITTVIVVSCPYGSLSHGGAQWGIARLKLRSGASGVGMTSGQLEWLGSNNLAPANFKLLIDTASTDNTRVNELWVYAAGSYQTWTVTKLTESGRSAIQENGAQGWKFTNNYAAEGSSAVTSGLTEVTPTFALSNGRNLYNDATGTTGAITLSETAANFEYLKIYYYSVHGSTKIYDSTEVYSPNGKQISLATNIYWSNAMVTTMRQISISGTALSNPSNEQAQFSVIAGSSPTRTTGSLIYIYRIDGFR